MKAEVFLMFPLETKAVLAVLAWETTACWREARGALTIMDAEIVAAIVSFQWLRSKKIEEISKWNSENCSKIFRLAENCRMCAIYTHFPPISYNPGTKACEGAKCLTLHSWPSSLGNNGAHLEAYAHGPPREGAPAATAPQWGTRSRTPNIYVFALLSKYLHRKTGIGGFY